MARTLREDEVRTLARLERVPEELALAIWAQESSSGRNTATSSKGARGGFQLLPATFRAFSPGGNIDDPVENAMAGIKYLRYLLDRYPDPELAAQAYYGGRPVGVGGKRDVDSGPGTPTITQYGRQVMNRMQQFMPPERTPQTYDAVATPTTPDGFDPDWLNPTPGSIGLGASLMGDFDATAPAPMLAQTAGMYGVDTESGLPMSVIMGLEDEGTYAAGVGAAGGGDLDGYLRQLVDSTLKGYKFG